MRSHDHERPAFGFTRDCLFSIVFVKYHGKTRVNRFIHDLDNRNLVNEYTAKLGSDPHSRFVLDFLIENWKVRGDFFFLFNTDLECDHRYDAVSLDDIGLLDRLGDDRVGQPDRTTALQDYLNRFEACNSDIAAVHFIPPVPAEGITLSIAFGFLKTGRQYPQVVRKILEARPQIQAYMYNVLSILESNDLVNESMRTAVGAIIGRVNAHDFGHVLNNAKLDFEDLDNAQAFFDHLRSFLRGLMVFGAEVATSDPTWSLPLPLIAHLIHYFASTPQRSKQEESPGWHRFEPSPVCSHLAESERVTRIQVRVAIDGERVEYLFDDALRLRRSVRLSDKKPFDLYVSVPTGLIGAHALYCIFENVIRNGAKYGTAEGIDPSQLTLSLDIATQATEQDELIRVRVWDDHSRFDSAQRRGFEKICQFFPPENRPAYLRRMEETISAWRIIDDQGQLLKGGWGLKEMRITAGWLRKQRVVDSLSRTGIRPAVLRPIVVNGNGQTIEFDASGGVSGDAPEEPWYIGYEFFLLKPKDILIVGTAQSTQALAPGIDAVLDLNAALVAGTSHRMWVLSAADKASLAAVQEHRQQIPATLLICPKDGLQVPKEEISANPELLARIVAPGTTNEQQMMAVQALHRHWLRKRLGAPERLCLIIQLSPSQHKFPLPEVAIPWKSLQRFFGPSAADGTDWQLEVGNETADLRFGYDSLIYDYHGVWGGAHQHEIPRLAFYEAFQGTQPTQTLIFNPAPEEWTRLRTVMALIEAAIARVAVVDERIFDRFKDKERKARFAQSGIHLPSEISYTSPSEKDFWELRDWFEENQIRIAAIHQGMIDKAFSTKEDRIDRWISEVKKIVPIIVVQSDRGEALLPRLPNDVRFVPFSSVEPWFTEECTNKYFLVQTLLSARRRVAEHGK